MAITVITPRVSIFPLTIVCGHCSSSLEIGNVRDTEGREEGMHYNSTTVFGVVCPVCKNFAKAPEAVQTEIVLERKIAFSR